MKNLKSTIVAFSFILLGLVNQSCKDYKNNHLQDGEKHMQTHTKTDSTQVMHATHTCRMHHDMKGMKGDKCSECGIEMEEMTHDCPMHHDIKGMKGEKCSECGMEMKENMDKK